MATSKRSIYIYSDDQNKANKLNSYFRSQTIIDDKYAILPIRPSSILVSQLHSIILTSLEVESILITRPIGKASGPDGMSNRILRELALNYLILFGSLFNESLHTGRLPTSYKDANVCPVPKKGDLSLLFLTSDPSLCLIQKAKCLKN